MLRSFVLVSALLALNACGDPLDGLDRISDVDLAGDEATAQALPSEAEIEREGFFGTSVAEGGDGEIAPDQREDADPAPKTSVAETAKRGGLLGLFRRNESSDALQAETATQDTAPEAEITEAADVEADEEVAALTPEPEEKPRRGGLFGLVGGEGKDVPRDGPDAQDVSYGTVLAYGIVARVCDAKGRSMGQKIETSAARGYVLYDSASGSATARTFYITGFSDGCPRQLTAANVLLGAPSLYEQLHYGPGGENLPVADTDKVYEKIKRKVCGVGKGKPCGSKISKMDRTTFFVSAYDGFGNSSRWTELLVHDGAVLAASVKTNG